MKMKELCEKTGLTRKTVMLYEEKGLFFPEKTMQNGRLYRDYSEEDVTRLNQIVVLRKARFTLAEIQCILEEPQKLPEVFGAYQKTMGELYQQMSALMATIAQIEPKTLDSVETLIQRLDESVDQMVIPGSDIHPRFRYLDEIEEERKNFENQKRLRADLEISEHLILNSATRHMSGPRELTLNNQQKLAVFWMLRDQDES